MKLNLLIVLQTHSLGDNQRPDGQRFVGVKKSEVMRRCTLSLIESINYAQDKLNEFDFELVVYDDHSDEESLKELQYNLSQCKVKYTLHNLIPRGIMPSILECYQHGKNYGKDWVYFAQDDYLYQETAIHDMILTAIFTSNSLQNYTCIFPYNDPYHYIPTNTAIQSHIIQYLGRHWRTQIMTACCFMVHHDVIINNWDLFFAMGTHALSSTMERDTINKLFTERNFYLFIPIPSLAFHMQYETEIDTTTDWQTLWDKYGRN